MERSVAYVAIIAVAAILLSTSAFALSSNLLSPQSAIQPTTKTIYMMAIEPKGSTTVIKEPFPLQALPPGGGYALKPPDEDGKWVVETYRWDPSIVVVNQGDEVTLEILGVNGAQHTSHIEGYDIDFTIRRGQLTTVTFVVDKAGTFRIVCDTHTPAMTAQLVVLPRA